MTSSNMSLLRPLSPELKELAENEINEVSSRIPNDIKHIREWIAKQPHLNARTDDQWLLSFLRGCKFSLERTKEKIDMYYTMRSLARENFTNRDPFSPGVQEFLKIGSGVMLPKTAGPAGPRVSIFRAKGGHPENLPLETIFKVSLMMLDSLLLDDDNFVVAGTHAILDLEGTDYTYLTHLTPSFIKKVIVFNQSSYPLRIKGVHVINAPSYIEPAYNTAKMLFNKKLANRLNIYSKTNMKELYKIIPLSILPKDYGGEERSMKELAVEYKSKFESYKNWFLEDAKYFSDETKRPGQPKTSSDMFGMEGSFRKLELD